MGPLCNMLRRKIISYLERTDDHMSQKMVLEYLNLQQKLHFIGAALQLRGINPIGQPLLDTCGNIRVYNGEIFGGVYVNSDCNDTEILMQALRKCCFVNSHVHTRTPYCDENGQSSVPIVLSLIKGPWAVTYWQECSKTLWFARDAFGRRSLLVHWPTLEDSHFLLSSVSAVSSME